MSDMDRMSEFFKTHSYDTVGDWRSSKEADLDPDDEESEEVQKYDPNQPRDKNGRWTEMGTGFAMVSPNVEEGLHLKDAERRLNLSRHNKLRGAFDYIDDMLGLTSTTRSGVGAWADGAEDSTITEYNKASFAAVRAAAAMKGWISDQKAVLAFQANPSGKHAMYETRVSGTMDDVHKSLIKAGIEFHTLVKDGNGVRVYAFDQSGDLAAPFTEYAKSHGTQAQVTLGDGDFIGSWDSREEGRQAYEGEIEGFLGKRDPSGKIAREWNLIRDYWSAQSQAEGLRKFDSILKFDPNQPRDEDGKWSKEGSIVTSDIEVAVQALSEGKKVRLHQTRQVSTLLDKLADMARDAIARGEKAPVYNLCNVSVKGTNLFCAENKGVPRVRMPQLSGIPKKGSEADKLPKDSHGGVDLGPMFQEHMRSLGVKVAPEVESAAYLRASQNELDGAKVASIAQDLSSSSGGGKPIFISREGYVIDGHHRWAATVGLDSKDGKLGDIKIRVIRLDMDILSVLDEANRFSARMGMPSVPVGKKEGPFTRILKH